MHANLPAFRLENATLTFAGEPILSRVSDQTGLAGDPTGCGIFLTVQSKLVTQSLERAADVEPVRAASSALIWNIGQPVDAQRFFACHRTSPFWMDPRAGTDWAKLPVETQFALLQRTDGSLLLLAPLLDDTFRYTLEGSPEGLILNGESNDVFTQGTGGVALFLAVGRDPYALIEQAAQAVATHLRDDGCRLRREKSLPDFIDDFGWCTWDAFYQEVSPEGIRKGLQSLTDAGVPPRFLIIDDGWLSTSNGFKGKQRLTSFEANHKFNGTLQGVVDSAKTEFGVHRVLAWHALLGSWSGVDGQRLPGYEVREVPRSYGAGILRVLPEANHGWWGPLMGTPSRAGSFAFYEDYHRLLAAQGIDGVKVDAQAMLECTATGAGGRVALFRDYRQALEDSVARNFNGHLINCMSHNTETWYLSPGSNLTRFSDDFYPNRPERHGLHLWINAAVGVWFGEFQHGDWDMFHSRHPHAALHAAGRAVSGGPVYVSDKPGQHDADLLRKLVMADGTVARAREVGRLSPDSLFRDPVNEACLLKIFNHNICGAVVGAFNARQEGEPISGQLSRSDAPGFPAADHVLYTHTTGHVQRGGTLEINLPSMGWEIITLAPVQNGLAVIGLAHLFNSGGAIQSITWSGPRCEIALRDGGDLIAWSAAKPQTIQANGNDLSHTYDIDTGRLTIAIPRGAAMTCSITR